MPTRQTTRLSGLPSAEPGFVEPMKCQLVAELPTQGKWLYELKFDGFRALGIKVGTRVQLLSRNKKDLGSKFPEIREALLHLRCKKALLDGEIVALDENGRPNFEALQNSQTSSKARSIQYYSFDLLNLDGKDLTGLPLTERRAILQGLLQKPVPHVHFSSTFEGDPRFLLKHVQKQGLEGIIGKKADSLYEMGQRSGRWIKYKCNLEQEFVVGGYTKPNGGRILFGSVLVGYYKDGQLYYASRVGTGFNSRTLNELYKQFQKLAQPHCPFVNLPEPKEGKWGQGITASEMSRCVWLRPELVCQVRFTEWTAGGHLRHPSFVGMREDKSAQQVVREKAA
jgi:bifunctional non-homologous end joining protein LigD